jgi:hypothetical protein
MSMRFGICGFALLVLTACGGGSSSNGDGGGGLTPDSFRGLQLQEDTITDLFSSAIVAESLPSSDNAEFNGIIVLAENIAESEDGYAGNITLLFDGNTLNGKADRFQAVTLGEGAELAASRGVDVEASMQFTSTQVVGGEDKVRLGVEGQLSVGDETGTLSGQMKGNFVDIVDFNPASGLELDDDGGITVDSGGSLPASLKASAVLIDLP